MFYKFVKMCATCCALVFLCGNAGAQPSTSKKGDTIFSDTLATYIRQLEEKPLEYTLLEKKQFPQISMLAYRMTSQSWDPDFLVSPAEWIHDVDIYIPDNVKSKRALLVINNGINENIENLPPLVATNYTQELLLDIARATQTIIVSVNFVPNQYLKFSNDLIPLREDAIVARSWKLFLDAPEKRRTLPLQVPMVAAASQAMRLAQLEMKTQPIEKFVVTGCSKRGWVAWLLGIVDKRVDAIIPIGIDVLNFEKLILHTHKVYGNNWPIALYDYYQEGIELHAGEKKLEQLMQIVDPMQYLKTSYAPRLAIKKYIISASGDDFFVPDNTAYSYHELPGVKALRFLPNSGHRGIVHAVYSSVVPFVNRIQKGNMIPTLTTSLSKDRTSVEIKFSEKPISIKKWKATNPEARDFRHACGIQYAEENLTVPKQGGTSIHVSLEKPQVGWSAVFVEAMFKDGFILTTPVYVSPNDVYPDKAPPSGEVMCRSLPGKERKK